MSVHPLAKLTPAILDRLNGGLWAYTPKPVADFDDLADFFGVTRRTVRRWYSYPNANGRIRSAPFTMVDRTFAELEPAEQARIAQPICMADGGLLRDPITTGTDREYLFGPYKLWECLEDVSDRVNGELGDAARVAWWRITIEPIEPANQEWVVHVWWKDPKAGEVYE